MKKETKAHNNFYFFIIYKYIHIHINVTGVTYHIQMSEVLHITYKLNIINVTIPSLQSDLVHIPDGYAEPWWNVPDA